MALKGVDTSWHDAGRQPLSIVRGAAIHNGENAIITGTKAPCGGPKPDLLFGSGWLLCRYFISGISKDLKKTCGVGAVMDAEPGAFRHGE